ncbi:uncharacterized protein [Dermacentor andersoni]|uniref:uncharacterized protein n=1 Tax=Dermacentor andersoni TaxID=34620 RepID=UPI003B3BE7B8
MAHNIMFVGGGSHPEPEARTAAKENKMDPDITQMYKTGEAIITYATTSTATFRHIIYDQVYETERCYHDEVQSCTADGCEFSRGRNAQNCFAKFTRDGGSEKFNAMNVSCTDKWYKNWEPTRTHEQILVQDVVKDDVIRPQGTAAICAVFKVTFLGGHLNVADDDHLPENEMRQFTWWSEIASWLLKWNCKQQCRQRFFSVNIAEMYSDRHVRRGAVSTIYRPLAEVLRYLVFLPDDDCAVISGSLTIQEIELGIDQLPLSKTPDPMDL